MDYSARGTALVEELGQSIHILEQSPIGICITDLDGHLLVMNDSFLDIVGFSREELIGKPFRAFTHEEDLERNLKNLTKLQAGLIDSYTMEKRYISKTGEEIHVMMKVSELPNADQTDRFILAQIIDITDKVNLIEVLKARNIQLNKVNRQLDSFIYRASHDLQGPLASMKGLVSLLPLEETDENIREGFQNTLSRLDHTIRTLVEYSGVREPGSVFRSVPLVKVLRDTKLMLQYHPAFSDSKILLSFDPSINITGDIRNFTPIVHHLMNNSMTFSCKFKALEIEIIASVTEENFTITFKDNGIGMTEQVVEQAFDMFFRGSERSEGPGLGLYLVREIVIKLNGMVDIKSQPEKGTEVTVVIPQSETLQFSCS